MSKIKTNLKIYQTYASLLVKTLLERLGEVTLVGCTVFFFFL
jgi:hypothetical protein